MAARIYSSSNRIRFTDIPEKYMIPREYRAKQCEVHSAVVTYVFDQYRDTKKYRQKVVDALNCLTYCVLQNDPPPFNWVSTDPLDTMPTMDMSVVESTLGMLYLTPESIDWDVKPSGLALEQDAFVNPTPQPVSQPEIKETTSKQAVNSNSAKNKVPNKPLHQVKDQQRAERSNSYSPTPKEDLYIQPPKCPRFDVNKVWMSANIGGDVLTIYTTLPEIPSRQNEISVTTNVEAMTDSELMRLYPNHVIHTRSPKMYERYDDLEYDDDLGCILPIEGFTKKQVVDNIIRYPHLYKLRKIGPDGLISKFFSTIEIGGELLPIEDVWDTLSDAKLMPRDPEFVKEYVIRRYLLEAESGIKHSYNIYGGLDPFLTLFMPFTRYIERGYTDTLSIVKQCVISRVHYKQSRSPILRRLEQNV